MVIRERSAAVASFPSDEPVEKYPANDEENDDDENEEEVGGLGFHDDGWLRVEGPAGLMKTGYE